MPPAADRWVRLRRRAASLVLLALLAAGLSAALAVPPVPASAQEAIQEEAIQEVTPEVPQPGEALTPPAAPAPPDGPQAPAPLAPEADDPTVSVSLDTEGATLSRTVVLILLLTVGSVAPGLLLLMTTFTRFVIVLGLVKNALGLQTVPPAQVLVGLALFLTFFVMNPVLTQVNNDAIQPLLAGTVTQQQALSAGYEPLREFMLAQTRQDDLRMFVDLSGAGRPATPADVSASTLIPAFVVSELRTAFIIGFVVFVPFLVIDLVVAAVLTSMGMVMLPPVFISLPLKLLLFVLVDGWVLIVGSLVGSVNGVVV